LEKIRELESQRAGELESLERAGEPGEEPGELLPELKIYL